MKKFALSPVVFPLLLCLLFSLNACDKDPEIITNTIVQTDTLLISQTDTIYISQTDTVILQNYIHDTATTFILLRHAETTGIGSDPDLSAMGQARADHLRRMLGLVSLDAVYSTNYKRTMQTAQPTATDKGLAVNIYNPANLNGFVDAALAAHHAGAVLVLGHSNTTPDLLNVLIGANVYSILPDTEYDNLFVVTVFEKGRAEVLHLKYGE